MRLSVIEPPPRIVSPVALPNSNRDADFYNAALIDAVTEEIDGPEGWLGRALGPQTIEMALPCFYEGGRAEIRLPCPPLIEVLSVKYDAPDGTEQTVDPSHYGVLGRQALYPKPGFSWPQVASTGEIRIRYRAGYDGYNQFCSDYEPATLPVTGDMPARVGQAIILATSQLYSVGSENLFLAEDTVDGVGSRRYVVSPAAGEVIRTTVERLLSGLRVY